jgi:hypothetical protein
MIRDDIALARRLWQRAVEHPELEPVTQGLSITTFRFVPRDLQSRLEEAGGLSRRLTRSFRAADAGAKSSQRGGGRFLLRACIVNPAPRSDVDALPEPWRAWPCGRAELRTAEQVETVPPFQP